MALKQHTDSGSDDSACSPSSLTPRMDKAAYEATTRTVGKWIVPLAKAQHIERELVKTSEKAEHLAIALVTANDATESLTRDLRTVIEVARRNMPKKHGTIERIAANLPENDTAHTQKGRERGPDNTQD